MKGITLKLTLTHVHIFKRYQGDSDVFSRAASPKEKQEISASEWNELNRLIHGIFLIKRGLASHDFTKKIEDQVASLSSDEPTAQAILAMDGWD